MKNSNRLSRYKRMGKRILSVFMIFCIGLSVLPQETVPLVAEAASFSGADVTPLADTHDHSGWTAWDDATQLPTVAGSYYLTTNVTLVSPSVMSANITLCLNGYTITYTSDAAGFPTIDVGKEGGLNIYDCQNAGEVTRSNGPAILVESGGTVNIYGGKYISTVAESTAAGYAAINIRGTANIYGGKCEANGLGTTIYGEAGSNTIITGGEFYNDHGGNVIQNYGTLEMSGCTVNGISSDNRGVVGILNSNGGTATIENVTVTTEGTATDDDTKADKGLRNDSGGNMTVVNCNITSSNRAVWNTGGSTITIDGGTFQGQYGIYNKNGKFELFGLPTFTGRTADIYLSDDQKITVTGALGNSAPYSVLTATDPAVGRPVEITDSGTASFNDITKFTAADSRYAVSKNSSGQLELAVPEHTHDDITFEPWTSTTSLPDSGSYYLYDDVTLSSPHILSGSLTLCLNGHTITYDKGLPIQVQSGGTLGIYDCQGNGAVVTDKSYCIRIFSRGTANIYGGTFNSTDYEAITVDVGGTVTIENASVFSSNSRAILNNGMATINGGTFKNTATGYPTIQLQSGSTTIITGGKFIRNTGSNVIQNQGKLEMSGGTVTGESSSSNGAVGIVNSGTSAKATIKNVTIDTEGTYIADIGNIDDIDNDPNDPNNPYKGPDKGLRNDNGGTMTVENCDINSSNWAVWNTGGSTIQISGGTFNGQYGIYNKNGKFELSGLPTFTGRTADIYLSNNQKITVAGALGNSAPYSVLTATDPEVGRPVEITDSSETSYNVAARFTAVGDSYIVRKNSSSQLELAVPATYTITYNAGSYGSGSISSGTKAEGVDFTLTSQTFTRTGYTQTGWSKNSNGSTKDYALGEIYTDDASITLYPYWTAKEYDIIYKDQGGVAFSGTHESGYPTKHTYGTATTLKSATKTGYTFGGWYTDSSCTNKVTSLGATSYTSDITLYAKWIVRGNVEVKTESGENAPDVDLQMEKEELENIVLTEQEHKELDEGKDIKISLIVEDASNTVSEEVKQKVEKGASYYTIGQYLDISLIKTVTVNGGEGEESLIHNINNPIRIVITIPKELKGERDRDYAIVRLHEGVTTLLEDLENPDNPDTITIETDRFSTYAMVYTELTDEDRVAGAKEKLQELLDNVIVTNDTTRESLEKQLQEAMDEAGFSDVKVTVGEDFNKDLATTGKEGKVTATVTVSKGDASRDTDFDKNIEKLSEVTPSPEPTPDTTPTPDVPSATPGTETTPPGVTIPPEQQEKNSIAMMAGLKVSQTDKKISIKWGKVEGADGYQVYATYCGKKFNGEPVKTVKSASITKVNVTKLDGKKLNLKKNYKVYVTAYKEINGKKVVIGKTPTGHIVGKNNKAYTNVKEVKVSKSKYTLKVGKSAKIKAKTVLVDKTKKQLSDGHAKEFRYKSTDTSVAVVSEKGKITAKSKGTCIIYVYARNGYAKKVKVTVK